MVASLQGSKKVANVSTRVQNLSKQFSFNFAGIGVGSVSTARFLRDLVSSLPLPRVGLASVESWSSMLSEKALTRL